MTVREILKSVTVETHYRTICELAYSKKPYSYAEHQATFRLAYLYLIGYFRGASRATCDISDYVSYTECLAKVNKLAVAYLFKCYAQERV